MVNKGQFCKCLVVLFCCVCLQIGWFYMRHTSSRHEIALSTANGIQSRAWRLPLSTQARKAENSQNMSALPDFEWVNFEGNMSKVVHPGYQRLNGSEPIIYVVTPTYARPVQKAELTRVCNSLSLSHNIVWIVIEDAQANTKLVSNFLRACGIPAIHFSLKPVKQAGRTIDQRNAALTWIRTYVNNTSPWGVLYFADDDNTYSPRLFEEMRSTKKVSIWPVGFASGIPSEGPLVRDGKVVDWVSGFDAGRKFPIDMAGFAVSLQLVFSHPDVRFHYEAAPGFLETNFIEDFGMTQNDLEPKGDNCTTVLVWHTQTMKALTRGTPRTRAGKPNPNIEV